MLKKYVVRFVVAVALLVAVTGSSGLVASSIGVDLTPAAFACNTAGSGGGGC